MVCILQKDIQVWNWIKICDSNHNEYPTTTFESIVNEEEFFGMWSADENILPKLFLSILIRNSLSRVPFYNDLHLNIRLRIDGQIFRWIFKILFTKGERVLSPNISVGRSFNYHVTMFYMTTDINNNILRISIDTPNQ